jgi:hypothetical protein
MDTGTVMGVNLAAGVAYLGTVARPCEPVFDPPNKVEPPRNVDEWERLKQFGQQFVVAARACNAVCVAFAETRKARDWVYSAAVERVSLQTAAALALRDAGLEVVVVNARTTASTLGFKGQFAEMDEALADLLHIDPGTVKHWKERIPAFATAAAIAREKWNG